MAVTGTYLLATGWTALRHRPTVVLTANPSGSGHRDTGAGGAAWDGTDREY